MPQSLEKQIDSTSIYTLVKLSDMVDFSKRLGNNREDKKTDPFQIYDSLDRKSATGPLRPVQQTVLSEWHNMRSADKDLVIKLHTGSGKTLIGLLILQARLNRNSKPCIYVCPNIYLANQVCQDAKKFGIPFCTISESNEIPNQFFNGEKILITYSKKVFNGKTIFGLDNNYIECDGIILDDSHACIDSIRDAYTIKVKSNHPIFSKVLKLFEDDLIKQGHGTFLEINDREYNSLLQVPFWSFIDKKDELLNLLSEYKEEKEILFPWSLIKDSIDNFQLHISGHSFELSPYYVPIERFGTFHYAKQRILMSATTQDDSFFIKGLAFSKEAVLTPLEDLDRLWSGEKMLLIPSLINDDLDRDLIVTKLAKPSSRPFGTVALTPSYRLARQFEILGSDVPTTNEDIYSKSTRFKKGILHKHSNSSK